MSGYESSCKHYCLAVYLRQGEPIYQNVKPGGAWDFKSQEEWDLNNNASYLFNGTILRYDDIGNIHYGFVGRVIFSEEILLLAGGVVQIRTGTSKWSYWKSNFDDPRDQWAIQIGCDLWR